MDALRTDLCRLTRRLDPDDVRLLLVGGYGLLLKAEYIRTHDLETVDTPSFPRATDDLDLLLGARVVADADRMDAVREALQELGYEPVTGGEYYQWSRDLDVEDSSASRVRIDLLGQIPDDRSGVKITERRIRPHDFEGLHAHPVPEAAFIHEQTMLLDVCPDPPSGKVALPHPFSFFLLKLYALDDRKDDPDVDHGRHHAFDLYRVVAMLTPEEWREVSELRTRHGDHEVVRRARRLVRSLFSDREAVGSLRLREHIQRSDVDVWVYPVDEFLEDVRELMLE